MNLTYIHTYLTKELFLPELHLPHWSCQLILQLSIQTSLRTLFQNQPWATSKSPSQPCWVSTRNAVSPPPLQLLDVLLDEDQTTTAIKETRHKQLWIVSLIAAVVWSLNKSLIYHSLQTSQVYRSCTRRILLNLQWSELFHKPILYETQPENSNI